MNLRPSKTFAFGRKAERSDSAGGMQGPPPGGGLGPRGLGGGGGGPGIFRKGRCIGGFANMRDAKDATAQAASLAEHIAGI
jgi:hypothetical protein